MSDGQMNGKPVDSLQTEHAVPKPAPAAPSLDAQLDSQIRQLLGIMFRGVLVSSPGIPPEALVFSITRVTGELTALMLSGDLSATLRFRSMIKEQFTNAVARQPVTPPPGAVPQNLNG